jgi:hypothetical protein
VEFSLNITLDDDASASDVINGFVAAASGVPVVMPGKLVGVDDSKVIDLGAVVSQSFRIQDVTLHRLA